MTIHSYNEINLKPSYTYGTLLFKRWWGGNIECIRNRVFMELKKGIQD